MEIKFTNDEALDLFINSLSNSLSCILDYGCYIDYNEKDYKICKQTLQLEYPDTLICFEDVIRRMLVLDYAIRLVDEEGSGIYNSTICLEDIVKRIPKTPFNHLADAILENDDATTGDVILQQCFFNEVIFG